MPIFYTQKSTMDTSSGELNVDAINDGKRAQQQTSEVASTGVVFVPSENANEVFQQAEQLRNENRMNEAFALYKKVLALVRNPYSAFY